MNYIAAIREAISAIEGRRARLEVRSIGFIRNAAWSYDKRRYAVLGQGVLQVWRAEPFARERTFILPAHDNNPGLAFSRDGTWIAVSGQRSIWQCDLATGAISSFCAGDGERGDALGFAEDGRLIQVSWRGEVCAWDARGRPASADDLSIETPEVAYNKAPGVAQIRGQSNAEGGADPYTGSAEGPRSLLFHSSTLGGMGSGLSPAISPDGRWLLAVAGTDDGQSSESGYALWDLTEDEDARYFPSDRWYTSDAIAFSADSQRAAFAPDESYVLVIDVHTGEPIAKIPSPERGTHDHLRAEVIVFWESDALTVLWGDNGRPRYPITYRVPSGEPVPADTPPAELPHVGSVVFGRAKTGSIRDKEHKRIRAWRGVTREELPDYPRPDNFACCALGPRGTLASSDGPKIVLRAPDRPRAKSFGSLGWAQHIEWLPDEQAMLITSPYGFGWYRPNGEYIGSMPAISTQRVRFVPGKHLTVYLSGGLILRWIFAD